MKKLFMSDTEYRKADGVANSTLLLMQNNPADVQWLKNAPVDVTKHAAADFGRALHLAVLEPELFDKSVFVSSVSGRATKTFAKEIQDNAGKIVLTESEAQQIRIMQASAAAHPSVNKVLTAKGDRESSIFVTDSELGIKLKIRPDIDATESEGFICNLKSTSSLDDWRTDKHWLHPFEKFNYWHDACYSLYVASQFYGKEIKIFKYAVMQKSVSLGRYPVGVFTVTKQQLVERGYWDAMLCNLREYARRESENDWMYEEDIPAFGGDGLEISEVE